MKIELTQVIDRPPSVVFRFHATEHVRNHPRWDPNMHLEQRTPGPIGPGTVIRRRYMRGDQAVEGEMEVVEYVPDRSFAVVIRDGPVEFEARATYEAEGSQSTRLGFVLQSTAPVERMDPGPIRQSLRRIKELIEEDAS